MTSSRGRDALVLPLLTAVYFAAGRLGLSLAFVHESTSAVWPPTGIAIAALLVLGMRTWPAIAAGAFLVNVTTSGAVAASAAIALGNTLEGLAGAWLTIRFAGGVAAFDRAANIFRYTLFAAIGATAIAATVGATALVIAGLASRADAASIWFTWWLGDAVGAMIVAPLVILWARPSTIAWTRGRLAEASALAVCLVVVSATVFGYSPAGAWNYPLQFLVVPILLWSAFRFGARETATAAAALAAIAIHGTLRGHGPFALASPNESLLLLQAFIGVTTTVMLAVAAEVGMRRAMEDEMRSLNEALERRVAARTEELLKVNDRLVEAQQVAHVGSWEWDIAANTLWWSDEMCRIFALRADELAGYESYLASVHPDDRADVDAAVRQAMVDGRPFMFDHRIVRRDGSIRVLHSEGRVVIGRDGRPNRMMGIGHDITERMKAEEARAQLIREQAARHEAEEANRAKDHFLAILSHELRTPLNAAVGWAHMLLELPPHEPRTMRAVDAIYRNLLIQARLVSDILDVSRIAKGALVLEKAPVDFAKVVDTAVEMVRADATAREITIDAHAMPAAPAVMGDWRRLQQVLWNLLSNAVKFGREGGRVQVELTHGADAINILVADDGPGIDPAFLPHIFEQFRQADPSSSRQHDGLGLGLAIAWHIVEQHGGTITAANAAAGGAEFTVRLPISN